MKFMQASAGNAQSSWLPRLCAVVSPNRHSMIPRSLSILGALTLALALPVASAHAADPLLSGYGGPGAGEQVVLGGTTIDGGKGSSSSASTQDPGSASLKADTTSPASSGAGVTTTLTRKPQRKNSSSSSSKDEDDASSPSATHGDTTTTATLPGAPEVVAYPTRADDVGGLPVSAAAVLLIVLGVAAATFLGLGLRRLSGFDRASDPQVPGR